MVEIDIPVYCGNCGRGICHLVSVHNGSFEVVPCEWCVSDFKLDAVEDYKRQNGLD